MVKWTLGVYSGAIDKIEQNIIPGRLEVFNYKTNLLDTDIIIKILK